MNEWQSITHTSILKPHGSHYIALSSLRTSHIFWYTQLMWVWSQHAYVLFVTASGRKNTHRNMAILWLTHSHLVKNCDFYYCKCWMAKSCNKFYFSCFLWEPFTCVCVTWTQNDSYFIKYVTCTTAQCFCLDHSLTKTRKKKHKNKYGKTNKSPLAKQKGGNIWAVSSVKLGIALGYYNLQIRIELTVEMRKKNTQSTSLAWHFGLVCQTYAVV